MSLARTVPMERERNAQTAPGEHPASSPLGRLCSTPLARLAPEAPAARLSASASSAPGGSDRASSGKHLRFFLPNDLSGTAGAFSLTVGGAVDAQCSDG